MHQEVVQNLAIPGLVNIPKPRQAVEGRFQMIVLLSVDEYHSRHYGNCSVSSLPHASASQRGSETVPDHVIFQNRCKGGKKKLGIKWNVKKMGLVLIATKIGQQMKLSGELW